MNVPRLRYQESRRLQPPRSLVVTISDEVEVNVSTRAWKLTYAEGIPNAQLTKLDGVKVPHLSVDDPIRSRETYGFQDRIDEEIHLRLVH